jgi:hypothetical protein
MYKMVTLKCCSYLNGWHIGVLHMWTSAISS